MNRTMTSLPKALFAASTLILALACGGGGGGGSSTPSAAATLAYTNPTAAGFQLVKNAASTGTHLILDVVSSTGGTAQGLGFTLTVDATKATFGAVTSGGTDYAKEGSVFNLGTGTKAFVAKRSAAHDSIQVGLFQKGATAAATLSPTNAMVQVALDLKTGTLPGAVSLSVSQAFSSSGATTTPITLNLGTLAAQ